MGPVIGIIAIVGAVVSAVGAISQAQAQARSLEDQASALELQARERRIARAEDRRRERRRLRQQLGKIRTGFAAGGVLTGVDTPLFVFTESELEGQREIQVKDRAAEVSARLDLFNAESLKAEAGATRTAGFVGAAGQLLQGAATGATLLGGPAAPTTTLTRSTRGRTFRGVQFNVP